MKRYNLKDIKGYITEEEGMYILHNASGSTQSCTKNEIDFYGGILVVQDLNSDSELDVKKVVPDAKTTKKTTKKKVVKK